MIEFACKNISLDEIIKCSFSLTKTELNIFKYIVKSKTKQLTTEEISKSLNLDLSTVQRAVKKLTDQDILVKTQKNLSSGGYIFLYSCKSKENIKLKIMDNFYNFSQKVENSLNKW